MKWNGVNSKLEISVMTFIHWPTSLLIIPHVGCWSQIMVDTCGFSFLYVLYCTLYPWTVFNNLHWERFSIRKTNSVADKFMLMSYWYYIVFRCCLWMNHWIRHRRLYHFVFLEASYNERYRTDWMAVNIIINRHVIRSLKSDLLNTTVAHMEWKYRIFFFRWL